MNRLQILEVNEKKNDRFVCNIHTRRQGLENLSKWKSRCFGRKTEEKEKEYDFQVTLEKDWNENLVKTFTSRDENCIAMGGEEEEAR